MLKKILQIPFLRKFFFPHYSELELAALAFLVILSLFDISIFSPDRVLDFINSEIVFFIDFFKEAPFGFFASLFFMLSIIFLIFLTLYRIFHHALHDTEKMRFGEKVVFSSFFYITLSIISIVALLIGIFKGTFEKSIFGLLYQVSIWFVLLQSTMRLLIMYTQSETLELLKIFTSHVTDEQINKRELLGLIIVSALLYSFFRYDQAAISTAIILSYFYGTLLINGFRKISRPQVMS